MLRLAVIFVCILFVMSCNKYKPDKLDGDLAYLVGTWNWDSTHYEHNWCTGSTLEELIYPEDDENHFSIVFTEDGFVSFYLNDSLLYNKGVTKNSFTEKEDGTKHAVFHLDGNAEDIIAIIGDVTASRITHFPFNENDPGCEDYDNYFSK